MKKYLIILFLNLLIVTNVYAKEIFLSCSSDNSSITLSFDANRSIGKEHVGGGSSIDYDLDISDTNILMQRYYKGKFVRSWNIDRYSGNATLYSTINSDPSDKSIRSYEWFCRPGSKKF